MILIELDGERQLVESIDGYDGWAVVAEGLEPPTDDAAELVDGTWVVPLEVLKARAWDTVKALRDQVEDGVAPTPVGPVQCDDRSKIKISGLVTMAMLAQAAGAAFEELFTLADNSVVTLDAAATITLGMAVGAHVSSVHARSRELRTEIRNATTREDLDLIDLNSGWPE